MASLSFESFPPSNSKNWNEVARKELGGKDPIESLSLKKQNLVIKPYYDASDTLSITPFFNKPSSDPLLGPRGWLNAPLVTVGDEESANKIALNHLINGADAVIYKLSGPCQLNTLLHNIELPYCGSYFIVENNNADLIPQLTTLVNAKGFDKTQIVGGIFWQSLPTDKIDLFKVFAGWDKFRLLGNILSTERNATEEIVKALMMGVQTIELCADKNLAFRHLAFSFCVGPDFFLEIAKLKAFGRLWDLVGMAYSITDENISVLLHGLSTYWNNEKYQPNANMLKSTTAAISCILGGCDLITIEPEDESNLLKSRISRNVLSLLREESHLNQPADATAGSYYLESLIDQMAKKAWTQFQKEVAK
ncbi:MAG TPA: methylmalonyl-CoA mutase family protein [Cyclobacteriaceae bacterium]